MKNTIDLLLYNNQIITIDRAAIIAVEAHEIEGSVVLLLGNFKCFVKLSREDVLRLIKEGNDYDEVHKG